MLNSILTGTITLENLLICTAASILLGLLTALLFMYKNTYSKNFVLTVAILPVIVQMVIMLVNGNLGAGVAVAGAFSLIRFRSAPGNAREINSVFLSMAIGLATGMGYIALAAILFVVVAAVNLLLCSSRFGERGSGLRQLRVTIPENVDYMEAFSDVFSDYASRIELVKVKTTNLGSLFELTYQVSLKNPAEEKAFIDALRCKNGNLKISLGRADSGEEL